MDSELEFSIIDEADERVAHLVQVHKQIAADRRAAEQLQRHEEAAQQASSAQQPYAAALESNPDFTEQNRAVAAQQAAQQHAEAVQARQAAQQAEEAKQAAAKKEADQLRLIHKQKHAIHVAELNLKELLAQQRHIQVMPSKVSKPMPEFDPDVEPLIYEPMSEDEQPAQHAEPMVQDELPAQHAGPSSTHTKQQPAQHAEPATAPKAAMAPATAQHGPFPNPLSAPAARAAEQAAAQPTAQAAALPIAQPLAQLVSGVGSDSDPDHYYNKRFNTLSFAEKKQIKKNMTDAVYMNYDDFAKNQDNTPGLWLGQLKQKLIDNGVNPDHAVRFLRAPRQPIAWRLGWPRSRPTIRGGMAGHLQPLAGTSRLRTLAVTTCHRTGTIALTLAGRL